MCLYLDGLFCDFLSFFFDFKLWGHGKVELGRRIKER
jgi:hypothetical protein